MAGAICVRATSDRDDDDGHVRSSRPVVEGDKRDGQMTWLGLKAPVIDVLDGTLSQGQATRRRPGQSDASPTTALTPACCIVDDATIPWVKTSRV